MEIFNFNFDEYKQYRVLMQIQRINQSWKRQRDKSNKIEE